MSTTLFDKNFKKMKKSVKKALTGKEMALKDKHATAIIIGTYHYHGSATFWAIAFKQPILENRISAWKFCHLLYKILREGHNLCCQESQQRIKYLTDLGKLWSHLTDGYGICILQFTKLLLLKIEFHIRNPRFPGTLSMPRAEIEQICGGDINIVYQLTTELYDYLDAIIGLQTTVFNSMRQYHVNSMTLAGQYLLVVLKPCNEEVNFLYDLAKRFMFKLHEHLSHDMLDGHRQRFEEIVRHLEVDDLPNFTRDGEYESNILIVPKGTSIWEELAVTNGTAMLFNGALEQEKQSPKSSDYFDYSIRDQNDVIQHSQNELAVANASIVFNEQKYVQNMSKLNDERIMLQNEIHRKDNILLKIQQEKQILEGKIRKYDSEKLERLVNDRDDLIQQLHTELFTTQKEKQILEEKIQKDDKEISEVEEKFAKLLPLYMKTRTDHINLLQQNQETNKAMRELKKSFEQLEIDKANVEKELTEMERKYEARQKLHSNWDLRKI